MTMALIAWQAAVPSWSDPVSGAVGELLRLERTVKGSRTD